MQLSTRRADRTKVQESNLIDYSKWFVVPPRTSAIICSKSVFVAVLLLRSTVTFWARPALKYHTRISGNALWSSFSYQSSIIGNWNNPYSKFRFELDQVFIMLGWQLGHIILTNQILKIQFSVAHVFKLAFSPLGLKWISQLLFDWHWNFTGASRSNLPASIKTKNASSMSALALGRPIAGRCGREIIFKFAAKMFWSFGCW